MKKLLSISIILIASGLVLLTSCKKEDAEAVLKGTWKVSGAVFNPAFDPGTGATTDAYSLFFSEPCSQDNLMIFQDGGVYIDDEGATKCDSTDAQQVTGSYTHTGTTIVIYSTNDTITLTNVNITKTNLTASSSFSFGSQNANVDFTLSRQ